MTIEDKMKSLYEQLKYADKDIQKATPMKLNDRRYNMRDTLETNYNGNPMTFIIKNITTIVQNGDRTNIFVVGSEGSFISSEPYENIINKILKY